MLTEYGAIRLKCWRFPAFPSLEFTFPKEKINCWMERSNSVVSPPTLLWPVRMHLRCITDVIFSPAGLLQWKLLTIFLSQHFPYATTFEETKQTFCLTSHLFVLIIWVVWCQTNMLAFNQTLRNQNWHRLEMLNDVWDYVSQFLLTFLITNCKIRRRWPLTFHSCISTT